MTISPPAASIRSSTVSAVAVTSEPITATSPSMRPEDVPGLADAGHGPGLPFRDGQFGVAGGAGRRGHGDDVLVEAAVRLVHGERRDALDRGAGGDQGDADALGAGLLGRRGGRVPQLGVVGQQHHLARVGPPDRLDQLSARRAAPPGRASDGGRAGLARTARPARRRGRRPRPRAAPAPERPLGGARRVRVTGPEVGDADPVRPPGLDARLHGRAGVVDVDVDVPQPVAADDDERVAERVEPLPQPATAASSASSR